MFEGIYNNPYMPRQQQSYISPYNGGFGSYNTGQQSSSNDLILQVVNLLQNLLGKSTALGSQGISTYNQRQQQKTLANSKPYSGKSAYTGQAQAQKQVASASPNQGASGVYRWKPLLEAAAKAYGLDVRWLMAIMDIESGGDMNARGTSGEYGAMQVMPFNYREGENPYDPQTNVNAAARLLKSNLSRLGEISSAIRAYNGSGPATWTYLSKWQKALSKY